MLFSLTVFSSLQHNLAAKLLELGLDLLGLILANSLLDNLGSLLDKLLCL